MRLIARQSLTLIFSAIASAGIVFLLTAPSRERLRVANEVINELSNDEADLRDRMALLDIANVGIAAIPPEMIWSGSDDSTVEIAQQQTLVNAANRAGAQILSFGAARGPDGLDRKTKAYEIELAGGHTEIALFLASVEQSQPRLAISYLWIRQLPLNEGQTIAPVNLRLVAWGYSQTGSAAP